MWCCYAHLVESYEFHMANVGSRFVVHPKWMDKIFIVIKIEDRLRMDRGKHPCSMLGMKNLKYKFFHNIN
ncbi:hypothetical protein JTB14_022464 [Gonioctena quinquepunctata]|nr:hypothetical protein JTB14_022464 [Gonioctena quinquepunctata]